MKTSILKGHTETDKKEIEISFKGAFLFREALSDLLKDKIENTRKESVKKDRYKDPSWAYYQADSVGYERAIREVISLLEE